MALSYSTEQKKKMQRLSAEIAELEHQIRELGFPRSPSGYRKLVLFRARLNQQRALLEQLKSEPFEAWVEHAPDPARPPRRRRRQSRRKPLSKVRSG